MKKILLLIFCLCIVNTSNVLAETVGNGNTVQLTPNVKIGEIPSTVTCIDYSEFSINSTAENDITFTSDYRPIKLLSDRKVKSTTKANFINDVKVAYNANRDGNSKLPKRWEFVKTIY